MKLKVILLLGLTLVSGIASSANQDLPFIGTRYFNFDTGALTGESITIQKNGTAIIKGYFAMDGSASILYKGKYHNPLDGSYEIIGSTKIAKLDKNGKIAHNCATSTINEAETDVLCVMPLVKRN